MQLGDKVHVTGYYQRNGRKPRHNTQDNSRYRVEDCDREGYVAGKRNIHLKGFTDYDSEAGYYFCSLEIVSCWLVAVSVGQCLYVPMDRLGTLTETNT